MEVGATDNNKKVEGVDAQYCVSIEVQGPDDEPVVREEHVELGLLDGRGRTIGLRITRYEFDYVPQEFGPAKWGTYTTPGHRFGAHFQSQIAKSVGVSESTVSRVLARAGLSKLSDLEPRAPIQRSEHGAPGDLLHIDTNKLGRIERPSHRVTGNRRDSVDGAGWEFLFVSVDDHARISFTAMHPDERQESAVQFLKDAGRTTGVWA